MNCPIIDTSGAQTLRFTLISALSLCSLNSACYSNKNIPLSATLIKASWAVIKENDKEIRIYNWFVQVLYSTWYKDPNMEHSVRWEHPTYSQTVHCKTLNTDVLFIFTYNCVYVYRHSWVLLYPALWQKALFHTIVWDNAKIKCALHLSQ